MIDLMNEVRYFLPHLLALSTSSPFWMGRDTGLKSYRTTIFRRFPAHRRSRPLRLVERVRELRPAARRPALHRRREEDLVGRAAASDVRHARVPRLRRADAARDGGDARRAGPGDHRQAVPAARTQPGLPPLSPRADRREQVARRALGARRQADRLRQARRSADARARRSSCSSSSTTWSTSWAAGGRSSTSTRCCAKARAPIGSWPSIRKTGDLKAVVRHVVEQTPRASTGDRYAGSGAQRANA